MRVRAQAVATPVSRPGGQSLGPPAQLSDPLHPDVWGKRPVQREGVVVVARGWLDERPLRLWFVLPRGLYAGRSYELRESEATQLVVGDPARYVSNRVTVRLHVSADGMTASVGGKAVRPELDWEGLGTVEFGGQMTIHVNPAEQWTAEENPALLPYVSYSPERITYRGRQQSPPAGYELRSDPRMGLVVAGSIMLGASYLIPFTVAAATGFQQSSGYFAIPVVGPALYLADAWEQSANQPSTEATPEQAATLLATQLILVQTGGLVLLTVGLAARKKSWVRSGGMPSAGEAEPGWSAQGHGRLLAPGFALRNLRLLPALTPSVQGLVLSGRF